MAYTSKWWDIYDSTVTDVLVADIDVVPEAKAYRLTAVDNGIARNCVVSTGGVLQAISNKCNNLLDSATIYDGQIIVRSAGNSGTNFTLLGGETYMQDGASVSNVHVSSGALFLTRGGGGTAENVTVYAGGQVVRNGDGKVVWKNLDVKSGGSVVFLANFEITQNINIENGAYIYLGTTATQDPDVTAVDGTISNLNMSISGTFSDGITLENLTVTAGDTYIHGTAKVTDATVTGGALVIESGGTAANVTQSAGRVYVNSTGVFNGGTLKGGEMDAYHKAGGATVNDLTVENGTLIMRWTNNVANRLGISGGTVYVQSNAGVTNINMTNGTLNAESGTITGGTITGGTVNLKNVTIANVAMTGGTANANGAITARLATLANLNQTAGQIKLQTTTVNGGTITGGEIDAYYAASQSIVNDFTVNGGTMIVRYAGNVANRLTIGGGTVYIQSNADATDINMTNGTLNANSGTIIGGTITGGTVAFSNFVVSNVAQTGGTVTANGNFKVSQTTLTNLTVTANNTYIYDASVVEGGTVTGGALQISSGGMVTGVTQTAGRVYVSGGAVFASGAVTGAELDVWDANGGGLVRDITIDNGGVVIARSAGNVVDTVRVSNGTLHVQNGASVFNADVCAGGLIDAHNRADAYISGARIHDGGAINGGHSRIAYYDVTVEEGGTWTIYNTFTMGGNINFVEGALTNDADAKASNGVIENLDLAISGTFSSGITLSGLNQTAGTVNLYDATVIGGTQTGGDFYVYSGGRLVDTTIGNYAWLHQGATASGIDHKGGTLNVFDAADQTGVERDAVTVEDVLVSSGNVILRGVNASGSGFTVYGGTIYVQNAAVAEDIIVSGGLLDVRNQSRTVTVDYDKDGATARNVTILGGATAQVQSGGVLEAAEFASGAALVIYKGGQAGLTSAAAGATIDLSFWDVTEGDPGNDQALITTWGDFSADAKVNVYSIETGYDYKIADVANANVTLDCGKYRTIFNEVVEAGSQYSNPFLGRNLDFSDGMTLTTTVCTGGTQETAQTFNADTATVLADGSYAAGWTANTIYSDSVTLAEATLDGDVWMSIDGADLSAGALYGAEGNFAHDVNMWLYEGTVKNLAAGAKAGGSVKNVKLLVSQEGNGYDKLTFTGVGYAGGFGSVTDKVQTVIYNGTFNKAFYAGALANKLDAQTSVGGVDLTVTGGLFKGNIYGASAVKTVDGTGSGVRNITGDVNLTLAGGELKDAMCVFAGGYATGTATGKVYQVGSISATISGGSWGTAHGGRGIFGGIMASCVAAEAGDVTLSVSDGTMGNVYGGGWAQKDGVSTVGSVNITVTGGTIANVFGGGSHSTSGGSTVAGDVTITVAGGSITNAIYARGQLDGDTTGAANVIFTGSDGFECGVYGYSYVGGAVGGAALTFSTYTGEFAGAIGGFDSVTFTGGTAMTLTTAADDVSNTEWKFDVSARAEALAGTALLDWDAADFTGDTIKLNLATGSTSEWTLIDAAATTAYNQFDVLVNDESILTNTIGLNEAIEGGAYDGWGFTLEDTVLKFKSLA